MRLGLHIAGRVGLALLTMLIVSTVVFAALHWLLFIPVTGFPILGWLALSAYCAVYPGLWVWLCWRLAPVPAVCNRRLGASAVRSRWDGVTRNAATASRRHGARLCRRPAAADADAGAGCG